MTSASLIYEGPLTRMISAVLDLIRWGDAHQHASVRRLHEIHRSGLAHLHADELI
ncbi:MAG: hypothetical protein AB8G95_22520 [Anaerolineae bacterium]